MEFTGSEENQIDIEEAAVLTQRYRAQMKDGDRKGGYISKDSLLSVLEQDGCVGIRYYYGRDEEELQELVIVGVTSNMNDIIADEAIYLDHCIPCPDFCGDDNVLNS